MPRSPSILLFGGTFDPPHRGHVELPQLVASMLGCNRIIYIPARVNPLKTDVPPTGNHHRLAMLKLALCDASNVQICTLELDRPGPSYTVDTLELLREIVGEEPTLRLLIGADQAIDFHRWKDWRRILTLAEPVVMLREPWNERTLRERLARTHEPDEVECWMKRVVHVPNIPVSSSELREKLHAGKDVDSMVHPDVLEYIDNFGLYID